MEGNDVLAVYEAVREAAQECRAGKGPVMLELLTYRITGHSRRDPNHYQPKPEREAWARREPIGRLGGSLTAAGIAGADELEAIRAKVTAELESAI